MAARVMAGSWTIRGWLVGLLLVMAMALPGPVRAQEHWPSEAPPTDDSALNSPRAAMKTFLVGMNLVHRGGKQAEQGWVQVRATLDTSALARRDYRDAARQLIAVLDKLGTVEVNDLPGTEVKEQNVGRFIYFPSEQHQFVWDELKTFNRWPEGQIVLEETAPGRWQFSAATVAGIERLYASMEPLAPRHLASPASSGDVGRVVSMLGPTFQRTNWTHWLGLLAAIFLGLLAGKITQSSLRRMADGLQQRDWQARATIVNDAASPASLALLALGLTVGMGFVWMEEPIADFASRLIVLLYMLAAGWFAYNLVNLTDLVLRRTAAQTANGFDDMVVPLIRKTLRIFMVIVFGIAVLQNVFQLNITGFLASLGIAGLAVSLAAQDSVKNLFGSLTVFFDRPFAVGQRIKFDAYDGVVEQIGFRSTRLRTLDGHLVTVPNMKFIDTTVENVTLRPNLRRVLNVTITYDTPPQKIEQAVQIIRELLHEPQFAGAFDMDALPPRVAFDEFNADSLNIRVIYWYTLKDGRDYWSYLEHTQQFNLRLFEAFGQAGIEFAFPTQTLYLAGDKARPLTVGLPQDGEAQHGGAGKKASAAKA